MGTPHYKETVSPFPYSILMCYIIGSTFKRDSVSAEIDNVTERPGQMSPFGSRAVPPLRKFNRQYFIGSVGLCNEEPIQSGIFIFGKLVCAWR